MNKQSLGYKNAFFSFVCVQFSSGLKYKATSEGDIHMMNYDPYRLFFLAFCKEDRQLLVQIETAHFEFSFEKLLERA